MGRELYLTLKAFVFEMRLKLLLIWYWAQYRDIERWISNHMTKPCRETGYKFLTDVEKMSGFYRFRKKADKLRKRYYGTPSNENVFHADDLGVNSMDISKLVGKNVNICVDKHTGRYYFKSIGGENEDQKRVESLGVQVEIAEALKKVHKAAS